MVDSDLLAVMLHMGDSSNVNEIFLQTLIKTELKFLLPYLLEVVCLRFQALLTFGTFPRSVSVGAC